MSIRGAQVILESCSIVGTITGLSVRNALPITECSASCEMHAVRGARIFTGGRFWMRLDARWTVGVGLLVCSSCVIGIGTAGAPLGVGTEY